MTRRSGDLLVGVFVLAMLSALIAGIALLTGRGGPADRYFTVYSNVTDVRFGTPVLYEGYPVGRVEAVTPRPSGAGLEFVVELSVARGWKIPADSVAAVVSPRVLSPVSIDIKAGQSDHALKPGDTLAGTPAVNLFAAMGDLASRLSAVDLTRLGPLLATLDESLRGVRDIVVTDGRQASAQLADLLSNANRALPPMMADLQRFSRTIDEIAGEVRQLVNPRSRERVEIILANLDRTSEDAKVTVRESRRLSEQLAKLAENSEADVEQSADDARYILGLLARDVDTIMHNAETTTRNIQEFSRQIRANPGLLIRGGSADNEAVQP
jgi:phospholipid/cholesterol/gamma-HCH transport system substrate-binding protein